LEDIHHKADPVMLNRCRSVFRQEVSFFSRSYMAAYLLLLSEGEGEVTASIPEKTGNYGRKERGFLRAKNNKKFLRETLPDESKIDSPKFLSEEESVQLFISIGRNRKVFPREILALIIARGKLARDDIGIIRVLDNYSFVQVRNTAADTVIETLNGSKFRGRILTVNYARSRKEEESQEENPFRDGNNNEE
jgi:RNA recognition motif-containing protein